jgi:hypothetical protein
MRRLPSILLRRPAPWRASRRCSFEPLESRLEFSADQVLISELSAVGNTTMTDDDGDTPDWIELYNAGAAPVDLSNWSLSDTPGDATPWAFPAGTSLAGGGFLVVFASGKNRATGGVLHTDFALNQDGETLTLADAAHISRATIAFGQQHDGSSFGAAFVGGAPQLGALRFFPTPTPGAANGTGVLGFAAEPTLSQAHGFYDAAFTLALSTATPDAAIYYTLDGSVPDPANPSAVVYNDAQRPTIGHTTTLRAAAFRADYAASTVATASYIFLDDVITQSPSGQAPAGWPAAGTSPSGQYFNYGMDPVIVNDPVWGPQLKTALEAIPSFSIVTDLDNLFDPVTGIYTNASEHGIEWERPTSIELIDPSGAETGFQADAGIRIRGGFSRADGNPKHAFHVYFRSEYGQDKLEYPLFGDEGASVFDTFDLRTDQNDSWAYQRSREMTMIHDVFSRDTQAAMGEPYTRSRFYHLYINGVYWGLFQTQERAEASYGETYFGGDKDDYDVVKSTGSPLYQTEATDGNLDAWTQMWQIVRSVRTDPAAYYRVQGLNPDGTRNPAYPVLLDIDNLIDYMTILFYTGDEDASLSQPFGNNRSNNWFGMRNRNGDEGFRFFVHDAEQTMFSNHNISDLSADRTGPFIDPNQNLLEYTNPQWLHQDLMASAEYRLRFADRVNQDLAPGGALSQEALLARWYARADQIALPIIAESARWGDAAREPAFTKDDWQYAVDNNAQRFIAAREKIFLDQLRNDLRENPAVPGNLIPGALFPSVAPPEFSQYGGSIAAGYPLVITAPPNETDSDTLLVAQSAAKRAFIPTSDALGTSWTNPAFNDSSWQSGTSGVGYERVTTSVDSVASLIGTDVTAMFNARTSVFVRTTFNVAAGANFDQLLLRMRYDDGFIAYLDGVEVVRSGNTPQGNPVGNTAGSRYDKLIKSAEEHDISPLLALLSPGVHTLAIHGYNETASSARMLILPELVGRQVTLTPSTSTIYYTTDGSDPRLAGGAISPAAMVYSTAVLLTDSAEVKARSLAGGVWSALTSATFAVPSPIRISEVMYHPGEQTAAELARTPGGATVYDRDEFEFIELVNTGDMPATLAGLSLADGVQFTFAGESVAPSEHVVLVRNAAAFRTRYGEGPRIVGEYGSLPADDRLSNSGEAIALRRSDGTTIHEFTYDDASPWPVAADGAGPSLVIIDEHADLSTWASAASWRASIQSGGSPGAADVLIGDFDADQRVGLSDLMLLRNRLGTVSGATAADGDYNGDGAITTADVALWMHHYGATLPPSAPRPAASIVAATYNTGPHNTAPRNAAPQGPTVSATTILAVRRRDRGAAHHSTSAKELAIDAVFSKENSQPIARGVIRRAVRRVRD